MSTPITDLSQSGLTKEQIKTLREHYSEEELAEFKHQAQVIEDDEIAKIIEERVFRNPKPFETFDIEEYKQYRQELEEVEGEFESFTQWRKKEKGGDAT
jgi:hypothetical protein